jgi:hypothetical protein
MKKFAWTLLVSISFCFLSACGGGGGGEGGASSSGTGSGTTPPATGTPTPTPTPPATGGNTPTVLLGLFLDSAVVNIKYKTATQSGTSNALGQFNYVAGETVTFSVGSVTLPPTLAAATITPMSLANTTDMGNNTVLNLLVFMQSLDDDGIPGNGIKIPNTANDAATALIDFNVSPAAFRSNPVFTALVANNSGSITKTPVTTAVALAHFVDTLAANNIVVPDPRPSAKIATVAETKVGNSIVLDGSASTDPKSASLSYNWTLIAPKGSRATLSKATEAKPSFSIDISGDYVVSLVVDNGALTNSSKLTVKGIDNVFGSSNLYLYGKDPRNTQLEVYVGCLTCDASQPDSICSADPASAYGITSSASSIWDVNSVYGNPNSPFSPWDFPGNPQTTPLVHYEQLAFNPDADIVALFSVDKDVRDLLEKVTGGATATDPRTVAYLEALFAAPSVRPIDVQAMLCATSGVLGATGSAAQKATKKIR